MDRLTNDTRPEIPVLTDDSNEFLIHLFTGTVCVDVDRQRLCDANGIRKLDEYSTSKPGSDQRLGYYILSVPAAQIGGTKFTNPPGSISRRTVDFRKVFPRESTSTMSSPPTIGINNNFTSS
jgi:hypothetical protein